MLKVLLSVLLALWVCPLESLALTQRPQRGPRATGAGAFPVSFALTAAWFGHRADSDRKEITLLVYFEGTAGWHDQKTDFKWDINKSPATIAMSVGTTPIHIAYWPEMSKIEILGTTFKLNDANVYLVQGVDGPQPSVKALGTHDLSFAPDDIPAVVLLQRNPAIWSVLTGLPPERHSRGRTPEAPPEVIAWDTEGLRLLLSGTPEDEQKGCDLLRRAAVEGYAPAQYRFGYCYESGRGVAKDEAAANQWYEKAASQGHTDAQYKLGHSYRVGRGVKIDLPTALQWYKKAAEQDDLEAMHNVGWMYARGDGVEANASEAFAWFLRAATAGETGSQYEVARRLRAGDGVKKDLAKAYVWLQVVNAQRTSLDAGSRQQVEQDVDAVGRELSETDKQHAKHEVVELLRTLAKRKLESLGSKE